MSDDAPAAPSDPYVIYQLRKPSQRGTAVIPRFVPNTHAPAFSPANYRFARVISAHRDAAALLHVPRSFEYAPSAGSDSSFWSSSNSFVSVSVSASTQRTAASHRSLLHSRAPFLHPAHSPMHSPAPPAASPFHYPAALAQSVSEDALVDTLLASPSAPSPQYPQLRPVPTPRQLPALTHKRRSLWQWLFCADRPAPSLAPPSIDAPPAPAKSSRPRSLPRNVPRRPRNPPFDIRLGNRPAHPNPFKRSKSWNLLSRNAFTQPPRPPASPSTKPPLHPNHRILRRVIPPLPRRAAAHKDRPRGFIVRDPPPAARLRFQRSRQKPHRSSPRSSPPSRHHRDTSHRTPSRRSERPPPRDSARPTDRPRDSARPTDRPRGDRPRPPAHAGPIEHAAAAPVPKGLVPSPRELNSAAAHVNRQRMATLDSPDPVTSRISSDLSSTLDPSSNSRASTPLKGIRFQQEPVVLDPALHAMSSDVSSHVSGGQEGKASPPSNRERSLRPTPPEQTVTAMPVPPPEPELLSHAATFSPPAMRYDPITGRLTLQSEQPYTSDLFGVGTAPPESSGASGEGNGNGLFVGALATDPWQNESILPRELLVPAPELATKETAPDLSNATDPVAMAQEKNISRSAGGPLPYMMKKLDYDNDADTHSTGLTSLADESVSTHKTISGVEEFRAIPGYGAPSRYRHRESKRSSGLFPETRDNASDGSATERPVIFKNSGLFDPTGSTSPGRVSSSASPRRFHSDWSDPHATDIDVYCQCSCSCVYEEECRRSCEVRYGRTSPSVSSSQSRRRYPRFQTLPPSLGSDSRYADALPKVIETSGDARASRNSGGRTGFESRSKGGYGSPSYPRDTEELTDPLHASSTHSGMTLPAGYRSKSGDQYTYANKPKYEYRQDSKSTTSSTGKRYRADQVARQGSKDSRSRTHPKDATKSGRRASSSPRYGSTSENEGKSVPRQHRSRTSSRTTNGSGSSTHISELPRVAVAPRLGKNEKLPGGTTPERRRRGVDDPKRHQHRPPKDGTPNVSYNHIVKRQGTSPQGHSQMPQPYRASGYGREVSYDYAEEGSSEQLETQEWPSGTYESRSTPMNEHRSVMEVEYETRPVESPDAQRSRRKSDGKHRTRRQTPSSPHQYRRGGHSHHSSKHSSSAHAKPKLESRHGTKQVIGSSRPSSKTSDPNRAPLFRIF